MSSRCPINLIRSIKLIEDSASGDDVLGNEIPTRLLHSLTSKDGEAPLGDSLGGKSPFTTLSVTATDDGQRRHILPASDPFDPLLTIAKIYFCTPSDIYFSVCMNVVAYHPMTNDRGSGERLINHQIGGSAVEGNAERERRRIVGDSSIRSIHLRSNALLMVVNIKTDAESIFGLFKAWAVGVGECSVSSLAHRSSVHYHLT